MKSVASALILLLLTSSAFGLSKTSKEVGTTESNAARLINAIEIYRHTYSSYPPFDKEELFKALKGKKDEVNPKGLPFWAPKKERKFLWWTTRRGILNKNG